MGVYGGDRTWSRNTRRSPATVAGTAQPPIRGGAPYFVYTVRPGPKGRGRTTANPTGGREIPDCARATRSGDSAQHPSGSTQRAPGFSPQSRAAKPGDLRLYRAIGTSGAVWVGWENALLEISRTRARLRAGRKAAEARSAARAPGQGTLGHRAHGHGLDSSIQAARSAAGRTHTPGHGHLVTICALKAWVVARGPIWTTGLVEEDGKGELGHRPVQAAASSPGHC